jgi:BirA family biotin operon repressor/biotin-[acetyl-CoA-carboxylase] ligase
MDLMDAYQRMHYLIACLSDGQFHSGDTLAQQLSVSRNCIRNMIKKLLFWQVTVYSVKGKGYKIPLGLILLNKPRLFQIIKEPLRYFSHIELLTSVDSTRRYIEREWKKKISKITHNSEDSSLKGVVCIAEHQSKGEGRNGQLWFSPFASNLYFSLGLDVPKGLNRLNGLSLAIGLSLVEYINHFTVIPVQLKWPNDILIRSHHSNMHKNSTIDKKKEHYKKLAGILVDINSLSENMRLINIGVGINWSMPQHIKNSITQPWGTISEIAKSPIDKTDFMAHLLSHLDHMIHRFFNEGFAAFLPLWDKHSAYLGRSILLKTSKETVKGVEIGIDSNGALKVMTSQGIRTFYSADVHLRTVEPYA